MLNRALADLLVLVHLAFIVFVVLGGLLALYRRWFAILHLPAAAWGVWIELSGGICPLTPLENGLRRRSGSAGYSGGFVEHYVVPLVYPGELTSRAQLVLAGIVTLVNGVIYAVVVHRWRVGRPPSPSSG